MSRRLLVLFLVGLAATAARAQAPLLLVGGGDLPPDALAWFAGHARGDSVLVVDYHAAPSARVVAGLRAAGAAVAGLSVPDTLAADDPDVAARVARAGALFFPGGDQHAYTVAWRGRAVARAAVAAWRAGTAVGGTSAGAMILGETAFVAAAGSVAARDALADPSRADLTLGGGAVPLLAGMVVETHVAERGRLGRMVAFVARHHADTGGGTAVLGVDDATALAVGADGVGTVYGSGVATWLAPATPARPSPMRIAQVAAGGTLDVRTGAADLGSASVPFVPVRSAPTRAVWLDASRPGVAVATGAWADADEEARIGGWAAAAVRERTALAVLVPAGGRAWLGADAGGGWVVGAKGGRAPALVLDLRATRRVASPAARVNGAFEGVLWAVPPGETVRLP